MVIGLALSNETVENACFMACHLLHRCKTSIQSTLYAILTEQTDIAYASAHSKKDPFGSWRM